MRAVLNPGDEVIILNPSYVSYSPTVKLAGGKTVYINLKEENEFKLIPEDLEKLLLIKQRCYLLTFLVILLEGLCLRKIMKK